MTTTPRCARVVRAADGWSLLLATLDLSPDFRLLARAACQQGPGALSDAPATHGLLVVHPDCIDCDPGYSEADCIFVDALPRDEMMRFAPGRRFLHAPHVWGGRFVFLVGPGQPGAIVTARLAPLTLAPAVPALPVRSPRRAS